MKADEGDGHHLPAQKRPQPTLERERSRVLCLAPGVADLKVDYACLQVAANLERQAAPRLRPPVCPSTCKRAVMVGS